MRQSCSFICCLVISWLVCWFRLDHFVFLVISSGIGKIIRLQELGISIYLKTSSWRPYAIAVCVWRGKKTKEFSPNCTNHLGFRFVNQSIFIARHVYKYLKLPLCFVCSFVRLFFIAIKKWTFRDNNETFGFICRCHFDLNGDKILNYLCHFVVVVVFR